LPSAAAIGYLPRRSAIASLASDESCKLAAVLILANIAFVCAFLGLLLLDAIWLLFGMDNTTGTGKVKTVSYWTQRRKIRAAVDEFFNDRENQDGPENVEAYQPEQDNTECDDVVVPVVHADVMTEEIRIEDIDGSFQPV